MSCQLIQVSWISLEVTGKQFTGEEFRVELCNKDEAGFWDVCITSWKGSKNIVQPFRISRRRKVRERGIDSYQHIPK